MNNKAAQYTLRTLLIVLANAVIGIGIALYYGGNLGSDPISVWVDGLHRLLNSGDDYGTAALITNGVIVVALFFIYKKYLHIGTIIITVSISFFINLFVGILNTLIPVADRSLPVQIAMMVVGAVVLGVGIGMQISIKFGTSATDALFLSLSDWTKKPYRYVRIAGDAVFAVAGALLGGVVGVGTVIGVLVTGPIAERTMKITNRTLLKKLGLGAKE